jgi:hypothetical protein
LADRSSDGQLLRRAADGNGSVARFRSELTKAGNAPFAGASSNAIERNAAQPS